MVLTVNQDDKTEAVPTNEYRCNSDCTEDEESSSSDSSSDSDSFFENMRESVVPKRPPLLKCKGELGIDDLPPIEDLVISLPEDEMEKIGKVFTIVGKLVTVQALKETRPLDLDSVLFLSHDKPLGRVHDVYGPVVQPFYIVRFNSNEDISDKSVEVDADVLFAPQKEDITSYVLVDLLKNQKGSDASWKDNNEPPVECLDYSDDEKERTARKQKLTKRRKMKINEQSDVPLKISAFPGNSSTESTYAPPPARRIIQSSSIQFSRPSPFSSSLSHFSPSSSLYSLANSSPGSVHALPFPRNNQNGSGQYSRPNLISSTSSPSPSVSSFSYAESAYSSSSLSSSRNIHDTYSPYSNLNQFSRPLPPPSSHGNLMAPVQVQNSYRATTLNHQPQPHRLSQAQSPVPYQSSILQRPLPSPLLHATYRQPQFGQMSTFGPGSSALHSPSPFQSQVLANVPALMPAPINPQNYFNQRFSRSPSPAAQNGPMSPDPWLPNQAPIPITNLSHIVPLLHPIQQGNPSIQPFMNENTNFLLPFTNQQNVNFENSDIRPQFY